MREKIGTRANTRFKAQKHIVQTLPKEFPIKNRVQTANHVLIGNYELGEEAKSKIDNYIEITSDTRPEDPSIKLHSGLYYHCNDVFNPEIGDIRLQFLTAGIEGNFVRILNVSNCSYIFSIKYLLPSVINIFSSQFLLFSVSIEIIYYYYSFI